MSQQDASLIRTAEVVLPCADLDGALGFFTERLGFRVDAIHPADAPREAVLSGYGVRLRLSSQEQGTAATLRLRCPNPAAVAGGATELTAPGGIRIVLVEEEPKLVLPPAQPSFVVSRMGDGAAFHVGRAGMRYRDLIPGRQGGRFIASHIQIPSGGPVPDYVHFHKVHFQMIYCHRGFVRLVYEDQGPPFLMQAGDCVLQPPRIRHRVLESAPGLEVIELGCPAEHETFADHELALPTPIPRPERDFSGQRFVHHRAAGAAWAPWRIDGFTFRDFGIAAATAGLAGAGVVRAHGAAPRHRFTHDAEFVFFYVLAGTMTLQAGAPVAQSFVGGDALVLPPAMPYALTGCSPDLELLEVTLPARFTTRPAD